MCTWCGANWDKRVHPLHDAVEQLLKDLLTKPAPFRRWLGKRRNSIVGYAHSSRSPLDTYLAEAIEQVPELRDESLRVRAGAREIVVKDRNGRIVAGLLNYSATRGHNWRFYFVHNVDRMYCQGGDFCGQNYVTGAEALAAFGKVRT